MTNNINCNCKGCKNRFIGCHGSCEEYARFKKKTEELNKYIRQQKTLNFDSTSEGWSYSKRRK